jgi:hypothetical protein
LKENEILINNSNNIFEGICFFSTQLETKMNETRELIMGFDKVNFENLLQPNDQMMREISEINEKLNKEVSMNNEELKDKMAMKDDLMKESVMLSEKLTEIRRAVDSYGKENVDVNRKVRELVNELYTQIADVKTRMNEM